MHRDFRAALDEAQGVSEYVVVVVADIRGFSKFSIAHESPDVAIYIKRVYMKMIDEYFSGASFWKPTGDGLLVTLPHTDKTVSRIVQDSVAACLRCLTEFPTLCQNDPMVNFEVPQALGFGLARGTACCLKSAEKVLDYSGHLLNLATRLMDLARPSGIVIDNSLGIELLDEATRGRFEPADVYLRSVAEDTPRRIHFLKDIVQLPESAKTPLRAETWVTQEASYTVREWRKSASSAKSHVVPLGAEPRGHSSIKVTLQFPSAKLKGHDLLSEFSAFKYFLDAGEPRVGLDLEEILAKIEAEKLRPLTMLTARIAYVPRSR